MPVCRYCCCGLRKRWNRAPRRRAGASVRRQPRAIGSVWPSSIGAKRHCPVPISSDPPGASIPPPSGGGPPGAAAHPASTASAAMCQRITPGPGLPATCQRQRTSRTGSARCAPATLRRPLPHDAPRAGATSALCQAEDPRRPRHPDRSTDAAAICRPRAGRSVPVRRRATAARGRRS